MKPGFSLLQIGVKQLFILPQSNFYARLKLKSWISLDIEMSMAVWKTSAAQEMSDDSL